MLDFIGQLGTWGPLLLILAIANTFLVVRYTMKLFGPTPDASVDINRIMILAVLTLAIGAFSHYSGMYMGLKLFGDFSSDMFAAGSAMSLVALLFGFIVFIVSSFCWLGLRIKLQSLSKSA